MSVLSRGSGDLDSSCHAVDKTLPTVISSVLPTYLFETESVFPLALRSLCGLELELILLTQTNLIIGIVEFVTITQFYYNL